MVPSLLCTFAAHIIFLHVFFLSPFPSLSLPLFLSLSLPLFLSLSLSPSPSFSLSVSLFLSLRLPLSLSIYVSLWLQDTCHLMPFTKYPLLNQSYFSIPLTISTTKRVNTCLIPSPVSWRIHAKKMDPCTSFCSKRARTVSCSGVPFGTQKSEMHFVVIYFGMRCVVPETPKPSFAGHARLHEQS